MADVLVRNPPPAAMKMNVAIRRLAESARPALHAHVLALSVADRRLRFGQTLPATAIASYVDRIDFERDAILGIHDEGVVIGMAHVAFDADSCEVGLSVVPGHRGCGFGRALFVGALKQAIQRGAAHLRMQFLPGNVPVLRIAHRFGMGIRRCGQDAEAHLALSVQHRKQISALAEIVPLHAVNKIGW